MVLVCTALPVPTLRNIVLLTEVKRKRMLCCRPWTVSCQMSVNIREL